MRSDAAGVAVIGGGFSGATLGIQLKRRGLRPVVIEPGPRLGEGAAYRTREAGHLLNIRAVNMSAWPERPRHFLDWLDQQGDAREQRFEPRASYARYMADLWADEGRGIPVVHDRAAAVERRGGTLRVLLSGGGEVGADAVVLATGNSSAAGLPGGLGADLPAQAVVTDPWSEEGMARVAALAGEGKRVLALGTGLTLADVAVTFARGGGELIALSRRGLLPQGHTEVGATPAPPVPPAPLRRLARGLRGAERLADWRPAVDGVRPSAPAIWRGWRPEERRRFLRHAGPWWSIHRRRTAPATARTVAALQAEGRLHVEAGRLLSAEWRDGAVRVFWRPRGGDEVREAVVDAIVNCTGFDAPSTADPLHAALFASGLARPDPLGLGLDVDEGSRVLDGEGRPQADLLAVGPPTKGAFWEIVAVPEIRVQVAEVAERLADLLTPVRRAAHG